jgi:hypothetical protein
LPLFVDRLLLLLPFLASHEDQPLPPAAPFVAIFGRKKVPLLVPFLWESAKNVMFVVLLILLRKKFLCSRGILNIV